MRKRGSDAASNLPPGGFRQKMKWSDAEEHNPEPNNLATLLVRKWSWGDMSTPTVQEIAAAAVADGSTSQELRVLAALGSSGKYPNHMHSELVSKLKPTFVRAALSEMPVCMRRPPNMVVRTVHPMLLPHALFACVFTHHKDEFIQSLCGGSLDNLKRFWQSMEGSAMLENHPIRHAPELHEKCVPLAIHGDGVPIAGVGKSWGKSVQVFSWTSLLSSGSTVRCCFLIYMLFWNLVVKEVGRNVYDTFSRALCWSFDALYKGTWPATDCSGEAWPLGSEDAKRAGKPLAEGFRGCLWLVKGDLEFMAKAFGFNWASSSSPCSLCRCDGSETPWTDGRANAKWMQTVWKPIAWAASKPDRHPLFNLPGVSILSYVPDVLHTLHLGAYQYAFGSAIKVLRTTTCQARSTRMWPPSGRPYGDGTRTTAAA